MSVLLLAGIGGMVSAISTSMGSLLAPVFTKSQELRKYHMSMDFALGVMLSAVAFSLVGPELIKGTHSFLIVVGLLMGSLFIIFTHKIISRFTPKGSSETYKILLISALIFHNLPEGMGAGAALAGMAFSDAFPLQVAISIQNVVEGLLLTLLLKSLGMSLRNSVLGGIFSGLIEMSGALLAGIFLQKTMTLLPFFLSLAGGAMMMSVMLELYENISLGKKIKATHFVSGMAVIPLTNFLLP
jgi:zinc transporter, ZIP family